MNDDFIDACKVLSDKLLPILGAVALIVTIVVLFKLLTLLKTLNITLLKSHSTIDLVDESLEKVQAPLDTAVKVSHTVDKAHDATVKLVSKTKDAVIKNADVVKTKVNTAINSTKAKSTKSSTSNKKRS